MTCIIGIEHQGKVILASDRAITRGNEVRQEKYSKIFKLDDMVVGCAGDQRLLQIVGFNLHMPKLDIEITNPLEYLMCVFVPVLRETLRESGALSVENGLESMNGAVMVGKGGELYVVGSNFCVTRVEDGFDAIGSGEQYALGVMDYFKRLDNFSRIDMDEIYYRLAESLVSAVHFDKGVTPPFDFLESE